MRGRRAEPMLKALSPARAARGDQASEPTSAQEGAILAVRGFLARNESAEAYPHVIVRLSHKVRVINCKDAMQWLVQTVGGGKWNGLSFCVTREALIRDACRRLKGSQGDDAEISAEALAVLRALPEWHPDR